MTKFKVQEARVQKVRVQQVRRYGVRENLAMTSGFLSFCILVMLSTLAEGRAVDVSVVEEDGVLLLSYEGQLQRVPIPDGIEGDRDYAISVSMQERELPQDELSKDNTSQTSKQTSKARLPPEVLSRRYMLRAKGFFKKRRYDEALMELEKAEAVMPNQSRIKTMKGSVYFAMGLQKLAQKEWEESLQLNPKQPVVSSYLGKLQQQKAPQTR